MAVVQTNRSDLEIIRDGRTRLNDNVGINSFNTGGTARNLLELLSSDISNLWDTMNFLLQQGFLTTSAGDSIDKIGVSVDEARNEAKRALELSASNFKFFLDETFASSIGDLSRRFLTDVDRQSLFDAGVTDSPTNPTQISLPAGLIVSSEDNQISYTTSNSITITNTQKQDFTPLIANGAGEGFNVGANVLVNHNIAAAIPTLAKVSAAIKCTNNVPIRTGADGESDDNYKFRIATKPVAAAKANETAIRKAALSVPGVVDVALIPRTHGNGTFTIIPRTVDPIVSQGIVSAVRDSVASDKSIADISFVQTPEYLAVTLKIEIRFAPGGEVRKNEVIGLVRLSIMDYINNIPEGGELIINELIQRTLDADENVIDMNISEFAFGDLDPITGAVTNYTPLRLLNQVADHDQRWFTNTSLCAVCETGTT